VRATLPDRRRRPRGLGERSALCFRYASVDAMKLHNSRLSALVPGYRSTGIMKNCSIGVKSASCQVTWHTHRQTNDDAGPLHTDAAHVTRSIFQWCCAHRQLTTRRTIALRTRLRRLYSPPREHKHSMLACERSRSERTVRPRVPCVASVTVPKRSKRQRRRWPRGCRPAERANATSGATLCTTDHARRVHH
jgi:hypothetical protein